MKTGKMKLPKAGHHAKPKPRLRTRHLSSTGKSAYAPVQGGAVPAFPPGPAGAGAPAFPDSDAGGAASTPLAGPVGGAPGM